MKMSQNAKDAIKCLQELKRKTKDKEEKKRIEAKIRDIKSCYN